MTEYKLTYLHNAIKRGDVILLLGSGASTGSLNKPDCCINSYVLVRETPLYKGYFAHWPIRLRFTPSEDELHRRDMRFALLLQHELPFSIASYATGR